MYAETSRHLAEQAPRITRLADGGLFCCVGCRVENGTAGCGCNLVDAAFRTLVARSFRGRLVYNIFTVDSGSEIMVHL